MKRISNFLIKRIFIVFCCTVLLSSNIFLAYETTVYASETEWDDALKAAIVIAGTVAGLFFAPEITAPLVIGVLVDVGYNSVTIGKYFYENSDGTYTISEDLIQAVIDAAEQLEAQGFTDSNLKYMNNSIYNYKWTATISYIYNNTLHSKQESIKNVYNMSNEMLGRVAGLKTITSETDSNDRNVTHYFSKVVDKNGVIYGRGSILETTDGKVIYQSNNYSSNAMYSLSCRDGSQPYDFYSGSLSFGGNFPIFTDQETMQNYLETGQGYKNAENYRPTPLFRRHSSYSPTYTGGPVTVHRTVINNINQKITEVESNVSLSDDQKIDILQQYILSGGTSPTPTPPPSPTDPDYDNNKDIPSGTDLSDTNSWLKKIYLKVCQIYAKMNDTLEDAGNTAIEKIQESLDEIISQLKQIKGWTIADTIIDGIDAVADWADFIKDLFDDADSGVSAISSTMDGTANLLKTKFPFCIPWDVYFLISFLAYEPETPVFHLPLKLERLGIDESIEVDMSQFQVVSDISRTLLTLIYCYALLNLTMKIFPMTKEET